MNVVTPSPTRRSAAWPLYAALISMALMAGLFYTWDMSVMPGLARLDDRTFVTAMQSLDAAIYNPAFYLIMLGALGFTGFCAVAQRGGARRWVVAALVLYLVAMVVTMVVHLPLNAALAAVDALGPPAELAAAREGFETPWRVANVVRSLVCVLALTFLARALTLHRAAPPSR